jgi:vacuolar-type H+-ATPase subunit I/STV1
VWRIFSRAINILLALSCEDKSFQTDLLRRIKGEDKKFFILITMNIAVSITIITINISIFITISVIIVVVIIITAIIIATFIILLSSLLSVLSNIISYY